MRVYKVIVLAAMAAAMVSCNGSSDNLASRDEIDDLKKELAASKESQNALRNEYIRQNEELTAILGQLNEITGKTESLRLDVENGSARMTQADMISSSIDKMKARIAALEKSNAALSGKNKNFTKMVEEFNKVIEGQERQINEMKQEILKKDQTIKVQKDTITSQYATILRQKDALQKQLDQQAQLLCEAGMVLEEIGDNAPSVSWKKNKEKVGVMTQDIYKKALLYYQKALEAGYAPAQEHIASVSAKIN